MKNIDYVGLSKEVSYALRHAPWEYELELDEEGWVPVEQVLVSLKASEKWEHITKTDILDMIEQSEKKRHEFKNDKIRAYYGHSTPFKIKKKEATPPQFLYHGTTHKAINSILKSGLIPCSRQYVHLSQDIETAKEVGKRRDHNPIILVISAGEAHNAGVKFYIGNDKVWLSDFISSDYIRY